MRHNHQGGLQEKRGPSSFCTIFISHKKRQTWMTAFFFYAYPAHGRDTLSGETLLLWELNCLGGDGLLEVGDVLGLEGPFVVDALVKEDANGPPIDTGAVSMPSKDLRSHISDCTRLRRQEGFLSCELASNVEVG